MGLVTTILQNKRITIGVVAVVVGGLYAYGAWVPDSLSRDYAARLKPFASDIKTSFKQVESGLNRQIFQTPTMTLDDRLRDLDALSQINIHARNKLDAMADVIPQLQKAPPGTGFIGAYSDAATRQTQAFAVLMQSRDVLSNYDALIGFMRTYYQHQAWVQAQLDDLNTVQNTDILAGQQGALYQTANAIYARAGDIKNTPVPGEFNDFKDKAADHLQATAKGYEQLAYGVSLGVNNQIYAAMRLLESAATDNIELNNDFFKLVDESSVMNNVEDLPAKAESLAN